MKITPNGIANTPLASKTPIPPDATPRSSGPDGTRAGSSAYTPSPELVRLLHQLGQQPEVREDRVAAVTARLQQGYYATSESAQATASAMLNSLD